MHVDRLQPQVDLAGADGGEVEQVVDQARFERHVAPDHRQQVREFVGHRGRALEQLRCSGDGRERRAQLVRQHREEAVLRAVGAFGFLLRFAQRLRVAPGGGGVMHQHREAGVVALRVVERGDHAFAAHAAAVGAHQPAVVLRVAEGEGRLQLAAPHAVLAVFGGVDEVDRAAERVFASVAEDGLRGEVPRAHDARAVEQDHRVVAQRVHHAGVERIGIAQLRFHRFARLAQAHFFECAVDRHRQARQAVLDHVVGRTALQHVDRVVFADDARDEDEREVRVLPAHQVERLAARIARQLVVGEDHVVAVAVKRGHEVRLVVDPGHAHVRVGAFQPLLQDLGVEGRVFQQQHAQAAVLRRGGVRLTHSGGPP